MRRFHNKSKSGCKQCRARRIKCDEARPLCHKCVRADLKCSFEYGDPAPLQKTSLKPIALGKQNQATAQPCTKPFEPLPLNTSPSNPALRQPPPTPATEERFSSLQLGLLRHFERDVYEQEKGMHERFDQLLSLYVDHGLTTPYLMDEILAYAAAHKAVRGHTDRQLYIDEAKRLQTRSLSGYNKEAPLMTSETRMTMFLYAGLLSHHLIAEANLAVQDGLASVINALTHSIAVHKGLTAMAQSIWPHLSERDQQTFISSCKRDIMPVAGGPNSREECKALMTRLDLANLDESTTFIYRTTVGILQKQFDAASLRDTHSMWAALQDWLVYIPQEYVALLEQMQPEALVILAHFGVLLHVVAEHWFVGDLGMHLVRLISEHLGAQWREWMEWPVQATTSISKSK